jgi:membrane protein
MLSWSKRTIIPLISGTIRKWNEDQVSVLGTSLAYYALFSFFPLLLIMLSVAGSVLGSRDSMLMQALEAVAGDELSARAVDELDVNQQVFRFLGDTLSPQTAGQIQQTLQLLNENQNSAGLFVFGALHHAFQVIWNVQEIKESTGLLAGARTFMLKRLSAFLLVIASAGLLLLAMLTGMTINLIGGLIITNLPWLPYGGGILLEVMNLVAALVVMTVVFLLLFKYLPDLPVQWGDVWIGALLTAVLFVMLIELSSYILGAVDYRSYGVVGSAMTVMLWIFLSSQVLFLGAEFTQVYAHLFGSYRESVAPPAAAGVEVKAYEDRGVRFTPPPADSVPDNSQDEETDRAQS